MFNNGTERPFTSDLLKKIERDFTIVQTVMLSYLHLIQNLIVEQGGPHFQKHYQERLKQK